MAGEINIDIQDDPAGCRALAQAMEGMHSRLRSFSDGMHSHVNALDFGWRGQAAEIGTNKLTEAGDDADTVVEHGSTIATSLNEFAGAVEAAKAEVEQIRHDCVAAKLVVTPTIVLPPPPSPVGPAGPRPPGAAGEITNSGDAPLAPENAAAYQQAAAFAQARTRMDEVRAKLAEAHENLQSKLDDPLRIIKDTKTAVVYGSSAALTYVKGAHEAVDEHFTRAEAAEKAGDKTTAESELKKASTADGSINKLSNSFREHVAFSGAQYVGEPKSWFGKFGKSALRGLPIAGLGVTAASTAIDIGMGKDPGKALAEGAGAVGGSLGLGAAAAAAGSELPIVGNIALGVVGSGVGAYKGSEFVDSLYGDY